MPNNMKIKETNKPPVQAVYAIAVFSIIFVACCCIMFHIATSRNINYQFYKLIYNVKRLAISYGELLVAAHHG
jgi:Fe2+ transport system protein B